MTTFKEFYQLISEGGAAGHIAHPFDIPTIKTGSQLINAFNAIWKSVSKTPASVKIDGVNVSFKVVGNQFALDRGSMKPIDVEGITIDRINERFPEGHGMRDAATTMLTFLNEAFPDCQSELKALGLLKDPTRFINSEYVSGGKTNVMQYDKNFLAFHGINKFEQITPTRRQSSEIPYSKSTLNRLAKKIKPYASKYGFDVVTSVPTEVKGQPNFVTVLQQPFTINYGENNTITKPLGEWLKQAKNPFGYMVKTTDGKKVGALSKQIYMALLNGQPLDTLLADKKDYKPAIDGAAFYHATRVLGNEVLNNLTSEMGDITDHEGVVVRDVFTRPVKITGEFIVRGLESAFRK